MTINPNRRILELRLNKLELFSTELHNPDLVDLLPRLSILTNTTIDVLDAGISPFDPLYHRLIKILDDFTLPYKSLQFKICEAKSFIVAKNAMTLDSLSDYESANEHLDNLYIRFQSEKVEKNHFVQLQEYRCRIKLLLCGFLSFNDSFMLHSKANRIINEISPYLPLPTITELLNLQTTNVFKNAA